MLGRQFEQSAKAGILTADTRPESWPVGGGAENRYPSRPRSSAETGNHTFEMAYLPSCEFLVICAILGNMPGWDVGGSQGA